MELLLLREQLPERCELYVHGPSVRANAVKELKDISRHTTRNSIMFRVLSRRSSDIAAHIVLPGDAVAALGLLINCGFI